MSGPLFGVEMSPSGAGRRWLAALGATLLLAGGAPAAQAANYSWNTLTAGLWTTAANWDSPAAGTAPANNATADVAVFNKTGVAGSTTAQLGADTAIGGVVVNNTGATSIVSDAAAQRILTLGAGGLSLSAGAGSLTLGSSGTAVNLALAASQTWTNHSSSNVVANGSLTRSANAVLNLSGTGTGTFTVTSATNTNGILGPWATVGSGSTMRFATVATGGLLQAYTGATSAATAASVTDTTGSVNYDVAATGALGSGASFNTLRYTGAAATITGAYTANGLMHVGSGVLQMSGGLTIGAGRELAVWTGPQNLQLSGAITNNAAGASSLVKSGTGAAALILSASNSYSGGTTLSGGNLQVNGGFALGTGGLVLNALARTFTVSTGSAIATPITVNGGLGVAGQGLIDTNTAINGLLTGTITLTAAPTNGGHFGSSATGSLTINGPIISSVPVTWARNTGRFGGGGSYTSLVVSRGSVGLTATNGLATSAVVSLAPDADATFDLAGFNQTLAGLTRSGTFNAVVTNSSTTSNALLTTTGTSTFTGVIQNGASRTTALAVAGGLLTLSGTNTYSGGSTVSAGTLVATTNAALGTGGILLTGSARQLEFGSVTIANSITIDGGLGVVGEGLIDGLSAAAAVLQGGSITINATPANGGHFGSASAGSLTVAAPINSSVPVIWTRNRGIFSGGGSYSAFTIQKGSNVLLGATNGLATSAVLTVGNAGIGTAAVFDLAGFSQSLVGLIASGSAGSVVGNSSTTSDSTLTTTGTSTFAGVIQDVVVNPITSTTGSRKVALNVAGGLLTLTGTNGYSGGTTVTAGELRIDGSLTAATGVSVGPAGTLGGSGSIAGAVSGAGLVSPGSSPGILTALQFDPAGGLDAAFEFTGFAPAYASPTASVNDVLRLTSGSDPFAGGSFTTGNVIDVYFNVDSIASGQVFEGGFFTGLSAENLLAALEGKAAFSYWIKDAGGARQFNGVTYAPLTGVAGITGVTLQTSYGTKDFGGSVGTLAGSVTQFVVVPEPTAIVIAGIGGLLAGSMLRGRHRRRAATTGPTSREARVR